jgi:hypothetical protein
MRSAPCRARCAMRPTAWALPAGNRRAGGAAGRPFGHHRRVHPGYLARCGRDHDRGHRRRLGAQLHLQPLPRRRNHDRLHCPHQRRRPELRHARLQQHLRHRPAAVPDHPGAQHSSAASWRAASARCTNEPIFPIKRPNLKSAIAPPLWRALAGDLHFLSIGDRIALADPAADRHQPVLWLVVIENKVDPAPWQTSRWTICSAEELRQILQENLNRNRVRTIDATAARWTAQPVRATLPAGAGQCGPAKSGQSYSLWRSLFDRAGIEAEAAKIPERQARIPLLAEPQFLTKCHVAQPRD